MKLVPKMLSYVNLILICVIHGYRVAISPLLPPCCRFNPTCSAYGLESLQRHGPLKGSWLTVNRLCRCTPWNHSERYDPVPFE
jgi:uncharacterized protein